MEEDEDDGESSLHIAGRGARGAEKEGVGWWMNLDTFCQKNLKQHQLYFLKTDFSEKIFDFKNAFLQQKSSEILRMFKIRIMTQTVIEMQFLPSQHSNAEEISSRMQKGSILKKNV